MLLLNQIVHLYDGKSGNSPARTMLELPYLLHFTNQYDQTMQQLKQNCQYYTLLITAIQKDTKKRLNPHAPVDEEPTGVDDGTGQIQDAGTVEGVLEIGTNDFTEGGDFATIQKLVQQDALISNLKALKDVYTQVDLSKVGEETMLANLIAKDRLGAVKIDQENKTLVFSEEERLEDIITQIESHNFEMVDVLQRARETQVQVKTSQEYAKVMVKKKGSESK